MWSKRRRREAARKEEVSENRVRMEMMLLDHFIEKLLGVSTPGSREEEEEGGTGEEGPIAKGLFFFLTSSCFSFTPPSPLRV